MKPSTKKLMSLKPLNFAVIKKELEERWDEPFNYCADEKDVSTSAIGLEKREGVIVNACPDDSTEKSKQVPLKDKSNEKTNECQSEESLKVHDEKNNVNTSSCLSTIFEEKENTLRKKNDSFDLDFTTLSLQTPVKNSVHSIDKNVSADHVKKKFEFLTPKVNNVITSQNNMSKKTYMSTPVNTFLNPLIKSFTPVSVTKPICSQRTPFKLPVEEVNHKNEEIAVPTEYSNTLIEDVFKRMKVNKIEYVILNLLGKGGSSEVYHCYNVETKCHVAIKCVSLQNSTSANSYINEVKLLHQLQNCDKIIKMYDYEIVDSQKKLIVVLEKGGEDLSTILKHLAIQQSHIPMYMLLFYWMEMLYSVKQIHSHGIIHSDLKPANFLKADGGLKLIDFGIASSVQTDMTSVIKSVPEGSCNYISPEALSSDSGPNLGKHSSNGKYKVHYKSDVWSLGCILYQFVYRKTPFQHINQLWPKLAAIMNPDFKIDYPDAKWVSPKIINTISRCLQHDVRLRPSIDELVVEYESILNNI
ncbi:hypothetical protein NQ318_003791 [Aromia moschata]|uniref:Protein kinase domain-containing protein n=1 Tax=Aromia moschata TaxID=1265417 RepID=A0AAV8YIP2_9CUCU|nr:hypothetical protein NQ318_003791 [Aromia moschata]